MINQNYGPEDYDDGLVDKYHVFKSPSGVDISRAYASYAGQSYIGGGEISGTMREVESFVFVLKPNHDHHARVAIAAYAASCSVEKPVLSQQLLQMVEDGEWGDD